MFLPKVHCAIKQFTMVYENKNKPNPFDPQSILQGWQILFLILLFYFLFRLLRRDMHKHAKRWVIMLPRHDSVWAIRANAELFTTSPAIILVDPDYFRCWSRRQQFPEEGAGYNGMSYRKWQLPSKSIRLQYSITIGARLLNAALANWGVDQLTCFVSYTLVEKHANMWITANGQSLEKNAKCYKSIIAKYGRI